MYAHFALGILLTLICFILLFPRLSWKGPSTNIFQTNRIVYIGMGLSTVLLFVLANAVFQWIVIPFLIEQGAPYSLGCD